MLVTRSRKINFPLITRKLSPSFFHVQSAKQDLHSKFPALNKADNNTERKAAIKFLRVTFHENITFKKHLRNVKTKLAKYIGLLYRKKPLLEKNLLKVSILRLLLTI